MPQIENCIREQLYNCNQLHNLGVFARNGCSALLYLANDQVRNNNNHTSIIELYLNRIQQISPGIISADLSTGVCGFGFVLNYMLGFDQLGQKSIRTLQVIDDIAMATINKYLDKSNVDYLYGASGILMYLIERSEKSKRVKKGLSDIIERYISCGMHHLSHNFWYDSVNSKELMESIISLGFSHGMLSCITLLIRAKMLGFSCLNLDDTIHRSLDFVNSTKCIDKGTGIFPALIPDRHNQVINSRLGWCYGDLPVAITYLYAAVVYDKYDYYTKAKLILHSCVKRISEDEIGYVDNSICHGYAGLGMLFWSAYLHSKEKIFSEHALYWKNISSDMIIDQYRTSDFRNEINKGTLDGPIGTVLANTSLNENHRINSWKKLFLLF